MSNTTIPRVLLRCNVSYRRIYCKQFHCSDQDHHDYHHLINATIRLPSSSSSITNDRRSLSSNSNHVDQSPSSSPINDQLMTNNLLYLPINNQTEKHRSLVQVIRLPLFFNAYRLIGLIVFRYDVVSYRGGSTVVGTGILIVNQHVISYR